jgi:hypothetical protein
MRIPHIWWRREEIESMKLFVLKRLAFTLLAIFAILAVQLAAPGPAQAIILDCPPVINIKAVGAPFPWTATAANDAILHFAEASYTCSNGTCTLSCAYSGPNNAYTLLDYKVPPGTCQYTNEGRSFACSSLPPPRHRKSID